MQVTWVDVKFFYSEISRLLTTVALSLSMAHGKWSMGFSNVGNSFSSVVKDGHFNFKACQVFAVFYVEVRESGSMVASPC